MKKIVWVILLLAAICVTWLVLTNRTHDSVFSATNQKTTNQMTRPRSAGVQQSGQASNVSSLTTNQLLATTRLSNDGVSNSVDAHLLAAWQAPIDFYGKTVDENSNALSGVAIYFSWSELPAEDGMRTNATISNSEGLFSLRERRGASLNVSFSKDGYYSSHRGQYSFNYALGPNLMSPDPDNPIVFRLWKKGMGTKLITSENGSRISLAIRVPKNDTPVQVNLFQKRASSDGELGIRQNKPPWQEATTWSFRMSISDGGFVENDDEFQFQAPEGGYLPDIEYSFRKNEANWLTHVTKNFYISFGQPRKFGWLKIESDLAQETVFLTYAINPEGSRNLEPQ